MYHGRKMNKNQFLDKKKRQYKALNTNGEYLFFSITTLADDIDVPNKEEKNRNI